jgi:uncharacterized protein YyaL (SSP411 family)
VLLRIAKFYGDEKYERFASTVLRLASPQVKRHPQGFGRALSSLEFHISSVREVVVIGDEGNELEREVRRRYLPDAIVARAGESGERSIPLLEGRIAVDGKPTAYVCENFVCQRPVTTAEELGKMLDS